MKKETWNVSAGRGVHMIVIRRPAQTARRVSLNYGFLNNTSFIPEATLWKWGGSQEKATREMSNRGEKQPETDVKQTKILAT